MHLQKYVYVLRDELNRVKLGITVDVPRRTSQISHASGLKIHQYYATFCSNAPFVEKKLLEYFDDFRLLNSEWLATGVDFNRVVNKLKEYAEDEDHGSFR